jgi:hypothetical protein
MLDGFERYEIPRTNRFQTHSGYSSGTTHGNCRLFPYGTVNPIPQIRGRMPSPGEISQDSRRTKGIAGNGSNLDAACGNGGQKKQLSAGLADLVLRTVRTIRICLVFLCQGQPSLRHLHENGSALFIVGGLCHFQAFRGEATVFIHPAH